MVKKGFLRSHLHVTGHRFAFHISAVISAMVRSFENIPECATSENLLAHPSVFVNIEFDELVVALQVRAQTCHMHVKVMC